MIVSAAVFTCSICGEPSTQICAYCTKDACANHRCVRCKRCSDCCECEVPLSAEELPSEETDAELAAQPPAEVAPLIEQSVFAEPVESIDPDNLTDFAAPIDPADPERAD